MGHAVDATEGVIRRLAVLDDYSAVAFEVADWAAVRRHFAVERFGEPLESGDLRARALAPYEVIVAMRERTPFPATLLTRLRGLRLLVTTGMWNRAIDMQAAKAQGIVVSGTNSSRHAPVELAWALIFAMARHVVEEALTMRTGGWHKRVGVELHGKTLGLIGLGRLGVEMARIGRAFGMLPIAWSQNLDEERARAAGAIPVSKVELLQRSDVLSIHVVLGERTRGLIGAPELALMKPSALLVNTSRGPIVVEEALIDALHRGQIAGAALDVYDEEPLPADNPLRRAPRLLLTPHIGIATVDNYRTYYSEAVEDVLAYVEGRPLRVLNDTA